MLRLIMMLPFLVVLVVFVLYNQTPGTMELPSVAWQSSVGVIALIAAGIFFVLGALLVWFSELGQRRRARRAEQQIRTLETQVADLHAQLTQAQAQLQAHAGAQTPVQQGAYPLSGPQSMPAITPPVVY